VIRTFTDDYPDSVAMVVIAVARMELTSSTNDFMEMIVKQSVATLLLIICCAGCNRKHDFPPQAGANPGNLAAFSDYRSQAPGTVHHIRLADLPDPYATASVNSGPALIPRPRNAWPQAPPGFRVQLYANGFDNPRLIRTAPNGDVFLAESAAGKIVVLRGFRPDGSVQQTEVYASGLNKPFGIGFYPPRPEPQWVYVANTDSVVHFPYRNGDVRARGAQEIVTSDIPGGGLLLRGGHFTRDIAFSLDGKKMFVSVGSRSNHAAVAAVLYEPIEHHRADILGIQAGWLRPPRIRLGDSQRGRDCSSAHDRSTLGLGERARRARRQSSSRLHHACTGWWFLRLALVLHGRTSGPQTLGGTFGTPRQGDYAGRLIAAAQRFARDDVL